jgi:hypothetical protein
LAVSGGFCSWSNGRYRAMTKSMDSEYTRSEPSTGICGSPGQTLAITTDAGTATAVALPAPSTPASPVDVLLNTVITFATEAFYNFAGTLSHIPL